MYLQTNKMLGLAVDLNAFVLMNRDEKLIHIAKYEPSLLLELAKFSSDYDDLIREVYPDEIAYRLAMRDCHISEEDEYHYSGFFFASRDLLINFLKLNPRFTSFSLQLINVVANQKNLERMTFKSIDFDVRMIEFVNFQSKVTKTFDVTTYNCSLENCHGDSFISSFDRCLVCISFSRCKFDEHFTVSRYNNVFPIPIGDVQTRIEFIRSEFDSWTHLMCFGNPIMFYDCKINERDDSSLDPLSIKKTKKSMNQNHLMELIQGSSFNDSLTIDDIYLKLDAEVLSRLRLGLTGYVLFGTRNDYKMVRQSCLVEAIKLPDKIIPKKKSAREELFIIYEKMATKNILRGNTELEKSKLRRLSSQKTIFDHIEIVLSRVSLTKLCEYKDYLVKCGFEDFEARLLLSTTVKLFEYETIGKVPKIKSMKQRFDDLHKQDQLEKMRNMSYQNLSEVLSCVAKRRKTN